MHYSLLLKYWPVAHDVRETLSGLSQYDIKKAALYSHTSRRNNNEPQGLGAEGESGCKCFMIWQRRGQSK